MSVVGVSTMQGMGKITSSDLAPSGKVHYSLGNVEFDLSGAKDAFETDELDVLRNADVHPWLSVDFGQPPVDPSATQVVEVDFPHTAIDAALPQKEERFVGEDAAVPTAETLAADSAQGDDPIVVNDPTDNPDEDEK